MRKIIALWASPRTLSTPFERTFLERKDTVVFHEPSPEPYLNAAKLFGIMPDKNTCVAIEDSVRGVLSAKAAGMYVVGISGDNNEADLKNSGADIVVKTLEDQCIKKII